MALTMKQEFCLNRLAEGDFSTWDICKMAEASGINKARCRYEWADAPMRELREKGFAELTGKRDRMDRRIHRITPAGRVALTP